MDKDCVDAGPGKVRGLTSRGIMDDPRPVRVRFEGFKGLKYRPGKSDEIPIPVTDSE